MAGPDEEPAVRVTLETIYKQQQHTDSKVTRLEEAVSQMININNRLDGHSDDIDKHGDRLGKVESQLAAQWVVIGIVTGVIAIAVGKMLFA